MKVKVWNRCFLENKGVKLTFRGTFGGVEDDNEGQYEERYGGTQEPIFPIFREFPAELHSGNVKNVLASADKRY